MKDFDWEVPNKRIVLVDVDGVLGDFVDSWIKIANSYFNRSYTREGINIHNVEDYFQLPKSEVTAIRREISRLRMSRTLSVLPGAVDAIHKLDDISELFFLTASLTTSETWEYDRRAWLDEHFGKGFGKRACFVKHKYLVDGDVFVDDHHDNINKWAMYREYKNRSGSPILYSQLYNEKAPIHNNVHRTDDWNYVINVVKNYDYVYKKLSPLRV